MSSYLRHPSIFKDQIVFTAENNLWTCNLNGENLRQLTSGLGQISNPKHSPDGKLIAFDATDEGAAEVYIIQSSGSEATRMTFLGQKTTTVAWENNTTCMFASAHESPFAQNSIYKCSKGSNQIEKVEVGSASFISNGDKGEKIIQRNGYGYPSWQRYQGGLAANIWVKKDSKSKFENILKDIKHNIIHPLLHKNRIYFISDFQGYGNIYSCTINGDNIKRHTHYENFYVREFSIYQDTLVYSQGACIWKKDLKQEKSKSELIPIEINKQFNNLHTARKFSSNNNFLEDAELCGDKGQYIAIANRGKLFYMPTWQGAPTLLSSKTNQRYHACTWLPKSKKLLAICDDGKKDNITIYDTKKTNTAKKVDHQDIGRVLNLKASPTENTILIANHKHELLHFDIDKKKLTTIDHCSYSNITSFDWSPDGKWVVYGKSTSHDTAQIILYNIKKNEKHLITQGKHPDYSPCFDPSGKFIYFLSQRNLDAQMDEITFKYTFKNTSEAFLCILQKDTKNPFIHYPEDDDENEKEDEKNKKDNKKSNKKEEVTSIKIDLANIEDRIIKIPCKASKYTKLLALKDKLLLITASWNCKNDDDDDNNDGILSCYDFNQKKTENILQGITSASLSSNNEWMIIYHDHKLRVIKAGSKPDDSDTSYMNGGWINTKRCQVSINPSQEWLFMFTQAWRLQKDFFWDKNMGNLDWDSIYEKYLPLVKKVSTRADLTDLISQLHGELGSSHAYVWGGESPKDKYYPLGYLGCQTSFNDKEKAWEIKKLYNKKPSLSTVQSPLSMPGLNIKEGDFITAINGEQLNKNISPESMLVNMANQHINLSIRHKGEKKEKNLNVHTCPSLKELHYLNWVEQNRQYVHTKSKGKLGYIHIPDMGKRGYSEFTRSYIQCFDSEGLIIDVRFNGGGNVSSLILEKLALKRFGLDKTRWHTATFSYPIASPKGTMVAICNEQAGSDGDMFSHAFKAMKLGKLIGKRTWGGVIGINIRNSLLDGGVTSQPEYAVWFNDVGYGIENHGVDPDITVEISPEESAENKDPQLDTAIKTALDEIKNKVYPDLDKNLQKTPIPNLKAPSLPKEFS